MLCFSDMNMPKYIKADGILFTGLMSDIFPGCEPAAVDYGELGAMIESDLVEHGYQARPNQTAQTWSLRS